MLRLTNQTSPIHLTLHHLNRQSVVAIISGIALLLITLFYVVGNAQQTEDRFLKKESWANEPIKIVEVKSAKKSLKINEHFSGDDEWFKGLNFKLKNDTDKTVAYISVLLIFSRPENQSKVPALSYMIDYGQRPPDAKRLPANEAKYVLPAAVAEFGLADEHYKSIRGLLDRNNYPSSVKTIRIVLEQIIYTDGTAWAAGRWFYRDSKNPDKFIPDEVHQAHGKPALGKRSAQNEECGAAPFPFYTSCQPEADNCFYANLDIDFYSSPKDTTAEQVIKECKLISGQYSGFNCGVQVIAPAALPDADTRTIML